MVCLGFSLQENAVQEEPWERQAPGQRSSTVTPRPRREVRTAARCLSSGEDPAGPSLT